MSLGRFVLRATVGGLFIGHGMQKLKGWFGGSGPEGTEQMMKSLDMYPPKTHALAAGVTETVSGAMLAAGFLTPFASAGIVGVMTTAIRKVHARNGVWNADGGWEFNAVMIASAIALASKPGKFSIDRLMGHGKWGTKWALGALAAGVASSTAAIAYGESEARKAA